MEPLRNDQVGAYLARIGVAAYPAPTPATLRELQWRHLLAVPFENLSIHLGEPVSLAPADLYDKIVVRRRGGFCYELNGLFAALLATLGYEVSLLGGRVFGPHGLGPPFDHLALLVGGELVDVGFGRHSAYPLRTDLDGEQDDPGGSFRVMTSARGDLEVIRDGQPQYRLEARARELPDFGPTCWWQQTHPDSHFRVGPVCSLLTGTAGQVTLAGRRLTVTEGGERDETVLRVGCRGSRRVPGAVRDHPRPGAAGRRVLNPTLRGGDFPGSDNPSPMPGGPLRSCFPTLRRTRAAGLPRARRVSVRRRRASTPSRSTSRSWPSGGVRRRHRLLDGYRPHTGPGDHGRDDRAGR